MGLQGTRLATFAGAAASRRRGVARRGAAARQRRARCRADRHAARAARAGRGRRRRAARAVGPGDAGAAAQPARRSRMCSAPRAAPRSARCWRCCVGVSLWLGAAAGALLAGVLLLALARSALAASDDASARLILTGAMLAAVAGALATLLLTLTPDERLRGAIFWLVGDLSGAQHGWVCLLGRAGLRAGAAGAPAQRRSAAARQRGAQRCSASRCGACATNCWSAASLAAGLAVATRRRDRLRRPGRAAAAAPGRRAAHARPGLDEPARRRGAARRGRPRRAHAWPSPIELPVGAVMALIGAPLFIGFLLRSGR